MNNEMYLMIFSGSHHGHIPIIDEVVNQLECVKERFGIEEIEEVESPLADLLNQYLLTLTEGKSSRIEYTYSTIKITYKEPVAFQVNKDFDTCLREVVISSDDPCGAHYTYLIKEDGHLSFHNTSAVLGWDDILETDDEGFYEGAISPETLYRAFYKLPLNDEDNALIAKMLLVAEGDE